jgi:4-amino-4-deoxy-L-arabinose transferase-like glycosyltransferase
VLLLAPTLGPDPGAWLRGDPLHYAAVARSTLESGDWLELKLGDEPYFNKPPLVFWAAMLSFHLFGFSTFAAELPGILAGLGCVLGTFLLGWRLVDRRHGFVAACVLCTTYVFLRNASVLRMDAPLTLALLVSLGALLMARRSRAWLPLFFAGVALGALAKGPAGLFPVLILLPWRALRRAPLPLRDPLFWSGLLLVPLLLLPWLLHVHALHGERFLSAWSADVERIAVSGRGAVAGKYAHDLLTEGWPWLPFLAHGAWLAARALRRGERTDDWALPVAWIASVLLVLLLLERAYSRYVLPMLPATSLLAARSVLHLWPRLVGRRLAAGMAVVLLAGTVVLASGAVDVTGDRMPDIVRFRGALAARGPSARLPVVGGTVSTRLQGAAIFYCDLRVDPLPAAELQRRMAADGGTLLALQPHDEALPRSVARELVEGGTEYDLVRLTALP